MPKKLPAVSVQTAPLDDTERFLRYAAALLRKAGDDENARAAERHANELSRAVEQAHAYCGAIYTPDDIYLPVKAAAHVLGVTEQTMRNWRYEGGGPAFVQPTRRVLYPLSELAGWLKRQPRYRNTTEASVGKGAEAAANMGA